MEGHLTEKSYQYDIEFSIVSTVVSPGPKVSSLDIPEFEHPVKMNFQLVGGRSLLEQIINEVQNDITKYNKFRPFDKITLICKPIRD